jgi:hypothetical protein
MRLVLVLAAIGCWLLREFPDMDILAIRTHAEYRLIKETVINVRFNFHEKLISEFYSFYCFLLLLLLLFLI